MQSILTVIRAVFAAAALTAIGQQLVLHVGASYSVLNFFSYFTNLSNLIAASVLLLCVFKSNRGAMDLLRYASVVNMAVVGLVFAVLLRDVDLGSLLPWVNFVLHYVMPMAIVLDWLLNPPAAKLHSKNFLFTCVFPALYLVYVVVRGAITGWYPYPFLNPANVGGYGGVAMYSLGIAVTFLLAAWALFAVGNRIANARSRDAVR
jgi:hypothetical protein